MMTNVLCFPRAMDDKPADEAADIMISAYKRGDLPEHVLIDLITASINMERAIRNVKNPRIQIK